MTKGRKSVDASAWMKRQPHRQEATAKRIFGEVLESGVDPVKKKEASEKRKSLGKTVLPSWDFRAKIKKALKQRKEELGLVSMKEAAEALGISAKCFERMIYCKNSRIREQHLRALCAELGLEPELED